MSLDKHKERIERFCRSYVTSLNATSAAIEAGYSKKTAKQQGSRLLTNVDIKARIANLSKEQLDKLDSSMESVLAAVNGLAKSNILDYATVDAGGQLNIDLGRMTREQAACVQEISVDTTGGSGDGERRQVLRTRIRLWDKTKALDMQMRHHGQYNDKLELSGTVGLADKLADIRKRKIAG